MKNLFVAFWVLAAFGDTIQSGAQAADTSRTISTSGEAVIYVVPDEVVVSFGLQISHVDLATAKQKVDADSRNLSEAVRELGIERRYFATENLDVSLRYANNDFRTSITAYAVSRSYMVTLKDISGLETLVDAVLTNGANVLNGVQFRSTQMRKHRDSARRMAIKAAREKAAELAGELDCGIGLPRTITESSGTWGASRTDLGVSNMYQNVAREAPASEVLEGESLPLGQIAIKATVNVTFDLVPGTARAARPADAETTR